MWLFRFVFLVREPSLVIIHPIFSKGDIRMTDIWLASVMWYIKSNTFEMCTLNLYVQHWNSIFISGKSQKSIQNNSWLTSGVEGDLEVS